MQSLIKLMDELGIPPKRWPTYDGKVLDRDAFLSASEMSNCLRMTWYAKQPENAGRAFQSNGYAERGNAVEAWVVSILEQMSKIGMVPMYMGENQRSFYDADLGISGTPDGLIFIPSGEVGTDGEVIPTAGEYILTEFKSIDPRVNKNNLPRKKHIMQVQVNMFLVSWCLGIEVKRGTLVYFDASDLFNRHETIIERHDDYLNEALDRADKLWAATSAEDLEPEGLTNGDCDNCPFTGECSASINVRKALIKAGKDVGFFAQSGLVDLSDVDVTVVEDYLEAKANEAVYTEKVEALKGRVTELVLSAGGTILTDGATLSARVDAGRVTVDTAAAESAGVDLSAFKKHGKPFTVLTAKVKS